MNFAADFDVLIVESVLRRRIIVAGIMPISGNSRNFTWKEEIYMDSWKLPDVLMYALYIIHLHLDEFWSVFAFAIVSDTLW